MLGKLGILVAILSLVLLFYLVISFGAGVFTQKEKKPETKKYLEISKYFINLGCCSWNYIGNFDVIYFTI